MTRWLSRAWLAAVVLGACLGFGCSKSGTFVVLDFKAGASAPQGVKSIDVGLTLGGQTAMTSYTAPGGGDITLPTSATLEIGSGSGTLAVSATARDAGGAALATAAATGVVTSGSTTHVTVTFGGSSPDGGAGQGGSSGSDGAAGQGGSSGTAGGQGGASGAAGEPSDAGPTEGGADGGPTPALLASDKDAYDFGTQVTTATGAAVGSTVVTITNKGGQRSGTLIVGVIDSSTFPTSGDTCSGMTLDPGASCMVTVKFMPGTAGAKSSKLQVGATPGGTVPVMLSGMGVDPGALSLTPDHGTFDPLPAGQTSATETTFTVKNTGGAATTALTAALTGTSAGEFELSTDTCTGKALAGGDTCTVGVKFAPTQAGTPGAEGAVLSVSATTGGSATANLMGTLLGPASIAIVPTDQDFLMIVMGQTSPEYFFMVTNKGGVASGALATGVSPAGEFAITTDTCNGTTLAPNGTCKLGVKMTPAGTGARGASLNVRATPGGNAVATLRGTGLAPGQIALQPQGAFNVVDVGSPVSVPYTVTNTGGAPTTALSLNLTGATEFTLTSDACTNMTLAPGASCMFKVAFTPTVYGPRSGMVSASATTGGSSAAPLAATGRDYVTLTVTKGGTGGGTVSASGLTCTNATCTGSYPRTDPAAFQVVNISATPDSLSVFGGWGGACTGTAGCQVTMSMAQTVTASFGVKTVLITGTISTLSGQTGSIATADGAFSCTTGTCGPSKHNAQATITFTATPGLASSFVAWSGGPCKGVNPTCVVPLTSDVAVTATFGPPNYMFVTSATVIPGRLNGIAGADAECAQLATTAGLPGTYKAWISDNATNANSRIGAGGWVRTDGRPFTRNLASLTQSNQIVYYPPRVDENGNDLGPKRIPVVTGGDNTGKSFGQQCNGATTQSWTQTTGSAYIGLAAAGSQYWAYNQLDGAGCSNPQHLYCFRADLAPTVPVVVTFPPANVRRVFISDFSVSSGGGVAAFDAECVADAKAAGYANYSSFIALVATTGGSALKRVNMNGPTWMRPDQVLVVATPADLASGNLISPIDCAADGATYKNPAVWTGGVDAATAGDATCNDWASADNGVKGRYGYPNAATTPDWFSDGTVGCDQPFMNVICIEP
ncbi:MAG TPA: choice-of-anchor D domain-containing protein [Polyangia bacterium]|nr:choice-of-anchor D domain-containing protein [Polyangia bacterium]